MPPSCSIDRPAPRWLHAWSILTLAAALPLVLFGAQVTTTGVGTVDPQGYRDPQELIKTLHYQFNLGFLWEYGHRLFGMLVGLCSIVLAVGLGLTGRTPLVRWSGVAAFVMVGLQGLLGIYRVDLDALFGPNLALAHGLFAQLVLAVLVGVVVVTSARWWSGERKVDPPLARTAALLAALVFVQIAFGGVVRHFGDGYAQRLHMLFAFVVASAAVALVHRLWAASRRLSACVLGGLLVVQLALGVEAWLRRFSVGMPIEYLRGQLFEPPTGVAPLLIRTAHFVVGAALFVLAVGLALAVRVPGAVPPRTPRLADRLAESIAAGQARSTAFTAPLQEADA
jgi:cytochrome c oxidase assembly protein subunit 15